jgi:serine/threonine-protein kinase
MAKAIQLGRYHLLDRIAFGGMAEIYRAKTFDDQGRVHMVAVKRILSHLARDEEFIKMLVDEARIASLMQHESIAKVYEFCHVGDEYFIAMEYVDGKDCRTLLDRCRAQRRWIPPELCAFVMMGLLRALHTAHLQTDKDGRSLHLIHRDVSPSNVICAYAGEVKLCDFGIAKATLSTVQTRSGVIKGKVKYMSPEQALGKKLDPRSDIFSAGSVLYELLTRVPPFLAPNEMELLAFVRDARYVPVRERNPLVPPALEAIVDTAMSRETRDRYQTANAFADALQAFIAVHAPGLTRSHLGRFVRLLFAEDIETELRALEEYVVETGSCDEVGVNLIAEDLGPDAHFSRFSPKPAAVLEESQADLRGEIDVAPREVPIDPSLTHSPTVILETSDLVEVATSAPAEAPAAEAPAPVSALDRLRALEAALPPPELMAAETMILDVPELEGMVAEAPLIGSEDEEVGLAPALPAASLYDLPTGEIDLGEAPEDAPDPAPDPYPEEDGPGLAVSGTHEIDVGDLQDLMSGEGTPSLGTEVLAGEATGEAPLPETPDRTGTQELEAPDLEGEAEAPAHTLTRELDPGDLEPGDAGDEGVEGEVEAPVHTGTRELDPGDLEEVEPTGRSAPAPERPRRPPARQPEPRDTVEVPSLRTLRQQVLGPAPAPRRRKPPGA